MVEQQGPVDTIAHHFDWPRLAIIAIGTVVAFAIFIWGVLAFAKYKRRRTLRTAMPRAYLLPMYVHRRSSRQSQSLSTPVHPSTTLLYPVPPEMSSPAYGGQHPALHRLSSITFPSRAHTRVSLEHAHVGGNDNHDLYVWGSVQHQTSRRGHRNHRAHCRQNTHESARDSVETLPRYEEPPSFKSDNGFQHAA